MESNFVELITLDDLSKLSSLNKYTLLRNFTKQRGVTPYQYLETIRIGEAKKLLEKGIDSLDAAMQTGFVDQSHFTKFFKKIIGLTPRQYGDIFKKKG
jgi:transcriptional regulator GlxA family with amidase domain